MLTQFEIAVYAEELRRAEEESVDESSEQWNGLRERRLVPACENRLPVAEWYGEYEEQTGTLLGCD
jgi:hypothetical protein